MSEKLEIKGCPFCGGKAHKGMTPKRGCQMHGDPMQYVTISCGNNQCPAKPSVKGDVCRYGGGDDPKYHAEATESAIKVWNTRADSIDLSEFYPQFMDCVGDEIIKNLLDRIKRLHPQLFKGEK